MLKVLPNLKVRAHILSLIAHETMSLVDALLVLIAGCLHAPGPFVEASVLNLAVKLVLHG